MKQQLLNAVNKLEFNSLYTNEDFIKETKYIFRNISKSKIINSILITQFNGIGDAILSTGFIESIHTLFPTANIIIICGNNCKEVFELISYIKLYTVNLDNTSFYTLLKSEINFIYDNNLLNIDLAISCNWGSKILPALFFNYLTGCKNTIGFGAYYPLEQYFDKNYFNLTFGNTYNFDNDILEYNIINPVEIINDIERKKYLLTQINILFNCNQNILYNNKLYLNNTDYNNIKSYITNKYKIVLCLGGGRLNKKYSISRWQKIINEIINNNITIYLLGGKAEENDANLLKNDNIINLVNKLTLRESIALISKCNIYVGHDTALAHVAYIYNLPLLIVSAEGKNKQNYKEKGLLSYYSRFYSTYNNCEFIQPKENIGECNKYFVENGCMENKAHCINYIPIKSILKAYKKLTR